MPHFSDRLEQSIVRARSILIAGIDPDIEAIPAVFISEAEKSSVSNEDFIVRVLADFYLSNIEPIASIIAGVKLNLAFFEQYGIGGLRAYQTIARWCREYGLPVIADAKRGDIGSTAAAYAKAFLQPNIEAFQADALTINPFLGFDTLEPFVEQAAAHGCGLFVLVRTSNPGASDLQSISDGTTQDDVSARIAAWIEQHASRLQSSSGLSGLGAVVGATQAKDMQRLRALMPGSIFLVPGFGAQGGSSSQISLANTSSNKGVIVNSSRGIFAGLEKQCSREATRDSIALRVKESNVALQSVRHFS